MLWMLAGTALGTRSTAIYTQERGRPMFSQYRRMRIYRRSARAMRVALVIAPPALFGAFAAATPTPTLTSVNGSATGGATSNASYDLTVTWDTTPYQSTWDTMAAALCTVGTSGPWQQFPQTTYASLGNLEVQMGGIDDTGDCDNVTLIATDTSDPPVQSARSNSLGAP